MDGICRKRYVFTALEVNMLCRFACFHVISGEVSSIKEDCSDALMVHRSTAGLCAVFGPQRTGATVVVGPRG